MLEQLLVYDKYNLKRFLKEHHEYRDHVEYYNTNVNPISTNLIVGSLATEECLKLVVVHTVKDKLEYDKVCCLSMIMPKYENVLEFLYTKPQLIGFENYTYTGNKEKWILDEQEKKCLINILNYLQYYSLPTPQRNWSVKINIWQEMLEGKTHSWSCLDKRLKNLPMPNYLNL